MITRIFDSELGKKIYDNALKAIRDNSIADRIRAGVVLGFSGGPDSVMLLAVLLKYKEAYDFPLLAVHINHMIRGAEANRDEAFSRELCNKLGVEFVAHRIDVPSISKENKKGIEEAAREVRYATFSQIIDSDRRFSTIAVAHNATDNLETVIFNMMRGAGISGISGISPVRDNIIRPLIYSSKADILSALAAADVKYVLDSTNSDSQYTRNYIRNEIIPTLYKINDNPERMCTRLTANLRDDTTIIQGVVCEFIEKNYLNNKISTSVLQSAGKPLFFHFLAEITRQKTNATPERIHADEIYRLLSSGDFSYSLPGKLRFVSRRGECFVEDDIPEKIAVFSSELKFGVNKVSGYSTVIIIADEENIKSYSNIYKISIYAQIPRDIINNGFSVRQKQDGDAYSYGGITRKLKKLFNEREIPVELRSDVPVFYDNDGIVWVPGFGIRSSSVNQGCVRVALAEPTDIAEGKRQLYFKPPSKSKR